MTILQNKALHVHLLIPLLCFCYHLSVFCLYVFLSFCSFPHECFLCVRIHPIPSMPPSMFYAYWCWCIVFGGWVDWTWWKTHLSFSNRGCANKWMGLQMKKSRMLQSCQLGCSWRMGFAKSTQRCALQESKNWKLFIFQQKHSSIEPTVGQMQPQQTLEEFHSIISLIFSYFSYCICTRNGLDWSGSIVLFLMWLKMWVNRESSLSLSGSHLM